MNAPRMLFLGSYPPRECGIATFTKDVVDSYDERFGGHSEIIAIEEPGAPQRDYPPTVVASLMQDDRDSYRAIADIRQPPSMRCAEHAARIRSFRRRERRMDRRPDRARAQAGHRVAAHRAARTDARSHARRAHAVRHRHQRRRALRDRQRHPDRPLRDRSAQDQRDPPRRARRSVPRHRSQPRRCSGCTTVRSSRPSG